MCVFFDATNELKCIEFRQSTEGENDDGATTSSLGSARWGKIKQWIFRHLKFRYSEKATWHRKCWDCPESTSTLWIVQLREKSIKFSNLISYVLRKCFKVGSTSYIISVFITSSKKLLNDCPFTLTIMLKSCLSKILLHSLKIGWKWKYLYEPAKSHTSPPLISQQFFLVWIVMKHFPAPNCVLLAQAERKQKLDFLLFFCKIPGFSVFS